MILSQQDRVGSCGPREEQRREVAREILTQYIAPHEHTVGEQAHRRLLAALRGD